MAKPKVEIQKGPLRPHVDSYRTKTHEQKVVEAQDQARMRRDFRDLNLHEPKQ